MKVLIVGKGVLGDATGWALEQRGFEVEYHDPPKGILYEMWTPLPRPALRHSATESCPQYPDAVLLCLPTPEGPDGYCGRSEIYKTADWLRDQGYRGLVGIRSTVIMGTCDNLASEFPEMELFSWPEFLQAARAREMAAEPPYAVVGWPYDKSGSLRVGHILRLANADALEARLLLVSPIEAEFIKYATNALLAASVGVANELAELAGALGLDWNGLIPPIAERDAVLPSNVRVIEPGGFGGTCLPKDLAALVFHAHELNRRLPVLETIMQENRQRRGDVGGCGE